MHRNPHSVFITGGSGFIGRHLVRSLVQRGYAVRMLARRRPEQMDSTAEVIVGDLTRPESFAPALEGVSTVIHAALTDGLSHDLEATSQLYKLSAQARVRQFLHLSTISVYGNPPAGTVTEDTPPIPSPDAYSSTKLAIEEALRTSSDGPEIDILRLGCVYGPGGGWWTEGLLNLMARGKLILIDGGAGHANLIHVEDVAAMVLLLLGRSRSQSSNSAPEIYNVTDGQPITWRAYFSELENIFGQAATIPMSVAEARDYGRKWLRPSFARRVARKLGLSGSIHPLDDRAIDGYASRAVYSNERASRELGFVPKYDFSNGIQSVRAERDFRPSERTVEVEALR